MFIFKIQSNCKILFRNFSSENEFKKLLTSLRNKLIENKDDELKVWDNFKNNKNLYKFQIIKTNFGNKFLEKVEENNINDHIDILKSFKNYFVYNKLNENIYLKLSYGKLLIYLNENNCFDDDLEKIFDELDKSKLLKHENSFNFLSLFSKISEKHAKKVFSFIKNNNINYLNETLKYEIASSLYKFNLKNELSYFILNYESCIKNIIKLLINEKVNKEDFFFIMKILSEKDLYFDKENICIVQNLFSKFNLKLDLITPTSSNCPNCNTNMPSISEEEMEILKEYFLNKIKQDTMKISLKSKIQLDEFLKFLEKNKNKFDIVIDGLNSSYQGKVGLKLQTRKKSDSFSLRLDSKFNGENIVEVLTCIKNAKKFNNLLVIGSKALQKYKNFLDFIEENNINCKLFNNDIKDDLCIILASLYNPNSNLHTNDLFRDHYENIKEVNIKKLFYKFQNTKVISFKLRNVAYNKLNEGWDKKVHMDSNYIHVPFKNYAHNFLFTWGCCKINDL